MEKQEQEILQAFKDFKASGKKDITLYNFIKTAGIKESEFFAEYGSLRAVEKDLHQSTVKKTLERLSDDDKYRDYTGREKLLAFCFTWFEELANIRLYLLSMEDCCKEKSQFLKDIYPLLKDHMKDVIGEAEATGELPQRLFLNTTYPHAALLMVKFLFWIWIKDTSAGFSRTDVAVEKSVNLFFDLTCRGPLESFTEFSRFLIEIKGSR